MVDAPVPAPGDVEPDSGGPADVPTLDRLLGRVDRRTWWQDVVERLRQADRRLIIAVVGVLVAVATMVGVVISRSSPSVKAEVSLPRATSDHTASGSSPSSGRDIAATDASSGAAATSTTVAGPIVVDVAGAVQHPGLVSVTGGGRVADAVAAAGGLRPDADAERLNLASPVADGSRIYVATVGQTSIPVPIGPNGGGSASGAAQPGATTIPAPIDLNTATADQLDALPGVGPSTAQAILAYRTAHGSFGSVDDLDQVRGIGPAKLAQLRDLVTVG